jgi:hypothetical protein
MSIEDAGPPGLQPGTTQHLAALAGDAPAESISEVLDRLAAVHQRAAETSLRGPDDGIAAFTRLYLGITEGVERLLDDGRSDAPAFLARLQLELAERYFAALRRYAVDALSTPRAWRVLFDQRINPGVPPAAFAVAGVNAHLNHDLAGALVSTWEHITPDDGTPDSPQYRDYCQLNEVFETAMDPLRDELGAPLRPGPHGMIWDETAAHLTDLVIRFTRDLAWDEAREVWTDGADELRRRASEAKLDAIAGFLGSRLLVAAHPF